MNSILNGNPYHGDSFNNRAFRYGDGLFETMRFWKGKVLNLEAHLNRLAQGIKALQLRMSEDFMHEWQKHAISLGAGCQGNARLRLTVFRSGDGLYLPQHNKGSWLLEAWPMTGEPYPEHPGLRLGLATSVHKPLWNLAEFKLLGSIPSILGSIEAEEGGFDDVVLLNHEGRVCETTSSNIFLVIDGQIHTPLPGEGQVEGTMKQAFIQACLKQDMVVISRLISITDLDKAQEILLSNAIQGLQFARQFEGRDLDNSIYLQIRGSLLV